MSLYPIFTPTQFIIVNKLEITSVPTNGKTDKNVLHIHMDGSNKKGERIGGS